MKMLLAHENYRAEDIPLDHSPQIGEIVTGTDGTRYRVRSTSEEWSGDLVSPIATVEPEAGLPANESNAGASAGSAVSEDWAEMLITPQRVAEAAPAAKAKNSPADEAVAFFAGSIQG